MLESAIPGHLQRPRTCPVNTPANYVPPFPAYCARFPVQTTDIVMAIIGAQYKSGLPSTKDDIDTVKRFLIEAPATTLPSFWEIVSVTDKTGAFNIAALAYWPNSHAHKRWEIESGFEEWWQSSEREEDGHGWFQETLSPTVDRFETVFSGNKNPEGLANMQDNISGEIEQHGYWGSMRDRLAAAQDDELQGDDLKSSTERKAEIHKRKRIRVPGRKNLCVIRSGQDWSDTLPAEQKLYLETMHPVLIEGMKFLRDEGHDIGCFSNNLWDVIDTASYEANRERTFGLGYFDDMASLEHWSKSHQTHINIFGGFLIYAKKLNNILSLRLFHEVYVLDPKQQFFEYVCCHERTGMLNAL